MHVLLVSERPSTGVDATVGAHVADLAGSLVAARDGLVVTWLRPTLDGDDVSVLPGVDVRAVPTAVPRPHVPEERLADVETERALALLLRDESPPDVVHVVGFGGSSSVATPWVCERLGVPCLVSIDSLAAVVCHRGTLVDSSDAPCAVWDDPDRCARCVVAGRGDGGLDAREARRARWLRILGERSPYPTARAFLNRLDLVVSGLQAATRIACPDPAVASELAAAGVPKRSFVELSFPPTAGDVLEHYDALAAAPA